LRCKTNAGGRFHPEQESNREKGVPMSKLSVTTDTEDKRQCKIPEKTGGEVNLQKKSKGD
jgi:hypothetical protein